MVLPGDRRAHLRQPCLIKCVFLHDDQARQARILNYCDAGAFVASPVVVHEGDTLLLRLRRPEDNQTVEVRAMVIHVVPRGAGNPGFGAQLFELLSTLPVAEGEPDVFPEVPQDVLLSRAGLPSHSGEEEPPTTAPRGSPAPPPVPADDGERLQIRARESRHVHRVEVRYALSDGVRPPREAKIVNISRGGLYLATKSPPAPNSMLTIWFDGGDVDGGEEKLQLLAQVVWSSAERPEAKLPTGVGCRVLGFNPEDHRKRWKRLLRDLLMIGNPLFRTR
jgi:Tfp pilus assembly protein PilZ